MTTKMLEEAWTADPTQLGRVNAGESVQIDVRVAFWRVPGGDAEAMRLVSEATALCVAAPAMAKMLLRALGRTGHTESCARLAVAMGNRGEGPRICSDDCAEIRTTLTMARVAIP